MGHAPHGILKCDGHIQVRLCHINSHKNLWLGHGMVLLYSWNRLFSGPALPGALWARIPDPGNCTGSGKTRARRAQGAPGSKSVSQPRTEGVHGLSRPSQGSLSSSNIQGCGYAPRLPVPGGRTHRGILEADLFEAVIGLAANLLLGASIPVAICVLNRNKPPGRRGKVLFVDAAQEGCFRPGKAQNCIDREHIE